MVLPEAPFLFYDLVEEMDKFVLARQRFSPFSPSPEDGVVSRIAFFMVAPLVLHKENGVAPLGGLLFPSFFLMVTLSLSRHLAMKEVIPPGAISPIFLLPPFRRRFPVSLPPPSIVVESSSIFFPSQDRKHPLSLSPPPSYHDSYHEEGGISSFSFFLFPPPGVEFYSFPPSPICKVLEGIGVTSRTARLSPFFFFFPSSSRKGRS